MVGNARTESIVTHVVVYPGSPAQNVKWISTNAAQIHVATVVHVLTKPTVSHVTALPDSPVLRARRTSTNATPTPVSMVEDVGMGSTVTRASVF